MPAQKRNKTNYPGVYYINGTATGSGKPEKIYYIMYRNKDKKQIHEKAGRQFQDDMSPAKASRIRVEKIEGIRLSRKEQKELDDKLKLEEQNRWTLERLFKEYMETRPDNKAKKTDKGRYDNYLKKPFGNIQPSEILPLDVERLKRKLLKKKSPQTVKHILNLLTWAVNFGVKNNICKGLTFHIKKPEVNNVKTENLSPEQLKKLFKVINNTEYVMGANMIKMALYTGMRRGEMFKLKWKHIDFERGFITLKDPKGGIDQQIPLNDSARELLSSLPKTRSEFVFPGRSGKQRTDINKQLSEIKIKADLPKDFRTLHGLRHVFASMLASSGKVDMYTLQKLLTHKDPRMTQRYAHLKDETLQKASNLAGSILTDAVTPKTKIRRKEAVDYILGKTSKSPKRR